MNTGFKLHKLLLENDNIGIENILSELNIFKMNNGEITNIILYFIKNNDERLTFIFNKIDELVLMKRDYMVIAIYYYDKDLDKTLYIFSKINHNVLETKDINYLINNKCYKLLKLLNGLYIQTNINDSDYEKYYENINSIQFNHIDEIKNILIQNIKLKELAKFNKFINTIKYDYIIDGCNILLYGGKISIKNINNLYKIINGKQNVLVIIHKRHVKKYPNIKTKLDELKINYYLTPYLHNDDYFILLAFLNSLNSFIISNDKYRDHIFMSNYGQFKYLIHNKTIGFNYQNIDNENKINMCIQINNDNILIPHINNYLIKI